MYHVSSAGIERPSVALARRVRTSSAALGSATSRRGDAAERIVADRGEA